MPQAPTSAKQHAATFVGIAAGLSLLAAAVLLRKARQQQQQQVDGARGAHYQQDSSELLKAVAKRSKAVMYIVSNKTYDKFSLPNLTKYLRMKGVEVFEGEDSEECLRENALRLLAFMEQDASKPGVRAQAGVPLSHELIPAGISPQKLNDMYPDMEEAYIQQPLDYGNNSRYGKTWKISCYIVGMETCIPKILPHPPMVKVMGPIMDQTTEMFAKWYCSLKSLASIDVSVLNAFVTKYRPVEHEEGLKKHIDGTRVDGSAIVALPSAEKWEGGELLVWDGKPQQEFEYKMKPGDILFMDNGVWHQANSISKGTRWALVIFMKLRNPKSYGSSKVLTTATPLASKTVA
mmetsp:Transcript_47249/g.101147  ORF Transcript_47249/g.101147 Transcript_47249/m.101147 type:complete len:348 (-) Transcript_47249:140-1183(-)